MTREDAAKWVACAADALDCPVEAMAMVAGIIMFASDPSASLGRLVRFAKRETGEDYDSDRGARLYLVLARRLAREVERSDGGGHAAKGLRDLANNPPRHANHHHKCFSSDGDWFCSSSCRADTTDGFRLHERVCSLAQRHEARHG